MASIISGSEGGDVGNGIWSKVVSQINGPINNSGVDSLYMALIGE